MPRPPQIGENEQQRQERETIWQQASTWLSRTLAVTLVMVLPGILGAYLDKHWGTTWLTPLGFGVGLFLGTTGLIVLARKLTPIASVNRLPSTDADSFELTDADDINSPARRSADEQ